MISYTNLILLGLPNIKAYYEVIITNFTQNSIRIARDRFEQLSAKQRKGFFAYLSEEHNLSSADPMYQHFFEML